MWHLTRLALRSRVITIIIALLLAGASIWALIGLKMELIPDISFPYTTVVTIYPDAAPDMVVNEVTAPIEKVVWDNWSGKELKHVTSTSSKGMSLIFAEFEFGTDMDSITAKLKEDIGKLTLPQAVTNLPKLTTSVAQNPQIIPINLSIMPLVTLSLSGDIPPDQLKQIASTQILPQLTDIDGVLRVDIEGGETDQVVINPNPDKMNQYGVSVAQMAGLLQSNYTSLAEVENTALGAGNLKLSDVAQISKGPPPLSVITRTNGKPSVGISVVKTEEANTVEVAKAVASRIEGIKDKLGNGVQITTVFDQSNFIEDSISQLWEKAIVGGVLAIIIVFIFLWAVRASLITAISIPLSVLIGFLCMRLAGITINLLTLSAMSIAVGRLIDDSIVMVEVIFRRRQRGESFMDAAIGGAKEVATPITAATLATVAIFLPLIFVGGIVGEMFVPFALTVTFAMIASLLVALMVVPTLSKFLVSSGKSVVKAVKDNWYQKIYVRALRWSLVHRAFILILSIVLFIGSLGLIPVVGTSFMSGMSEKMITVNIQLPAGSEVNQTSETAAKVEALLVNNKAFKNIQTTIGTSTSMAGIMSASQGGGTNTATITAYLDPGADIMKETDALTLATAGMVNGGSIKVSNSESGGAAGFSTSGINLSVQGQDQEAVARVTTQLMEKLKGVNGLADLKNDLTTVAPKLNIAIDTTKIATSGLPAAQMGQIQQEFMLLMMGSTIPGKTVTIGNSAYPIYFQSVTNNLSSAEQAQKLRIGFPQSVALADIANVAVLELPSHVSHTDTSLSASITGSVTEKNVGAVNKAIQQKIDELPAHPGVEIKMAGIAEYMSDTFSKMFIAIIVAIIIVFLIVILMMRSIRNPLMIMVSLPLASIGAVLALLFSGFTVGVSAMMGILMLVGIVLTNAIVLVTLVETLRKSGMTTQEALIEGGKTRLRPILMTALTTIFAMIPLAVGVGSGTILSAELAVVVIGGLFSSTFLTLFVIPVIYSYAHKKQAAAAKK
jgi:hydrophobic/amphiphilic exporter-1 (mainly G- bacteria), HAE1 family